MEDYLNYMNSVSESESLSNQVNALKENLINQGDEALSQADINDESKDQLKENILGLPSELAISTAGTFLAKKAFSYVSSKIGVSEDTVSKFVSGDIEGGLKQGLGELATKNLPVAGQGSPAEDPDLQGGSLEDPPMTPEQEGDIELDDLSPPSQEDALNMLSSAERPTITGEDLPEGAGAIEDFGETINTGLSSATDVASGLASSAGDVASGLASSAGDVASGLASSAGDFASGLASSATDVASGLASSAGDFASGIASSASDMVSGALSSATDVASGALSSATDIAGGIASTATEVASDVAVGALETAGVALDATGVGAIAGAVLGLVGGLVGFFEGSHHDAPKIPAPVQIFEPMLNPSSQIL